MSLNIAGRLDENLRLHPEKTAILYRAGSGWERVTYGQLGGMVQRMEAGLAALGLHAGAKAVLMAPPGIHFFALVFALARRGIPPVLADPGIGLRAVGRCLAESGAEVYIGNRLTQALRLLSGWGRASIHTSLNVADIWRAGQRVPASAPDSEAALEEAAIIFTSGSTGLPKGALYTHANLLAQVDSLVSTLGLTGNEIDLPAFPVFALIDLLVGVTAVIPDMRFPRPAQVNAVRMLEAVQTFAVDTLFASPVVLDRLARAGLPQAARLLSLRRVITAGAPAPVPVLERFRKLLAPEAKVYSVYGSTEALPITLIDCQEVLDETRQASAAGAGICVGRPVAGVQVCILPIRDGPLQPEDLHELPAGETGEIVVEGGAVTASYCGSQEHNRLAKITAVGKVQHRMGDLGYLDAQGRLWYCGRKTQRVETARGMLFTEQVEGIFNAHPEVYRSALVGLRREGQVEPVLWVELQKGTSRSRQVNLRAELLEMGQHHEMTRAIRTILFLRAFPTDVRHNSKIIREALARQAEKALV